MSAQEPEVVPSSTLETAMTDDDELETVCRICRMPAEAENPLYHPCRCSGSIRYVHSSCLNVWLARSKHDSCEVCAPAHSTLLSRAEHSSHELGLRSALLSRAFATCNRPEIRFHPAQTQHFHCLDSTLLAERSMALGFWTSLTRASVLSPSAHSKLREALHGVLKIACTCANSNVRFQDHISRMLQLCKLVVFSNVLLMQQNLVSFTVS